MRERLRSLLAVARRHAPIPAALILLLLTLWVILSLGSQRAAIQTQSKQITALAGGLTTAEAQLTQHGISPIPKPPAAIVSEVAGPAGPPGPAPSDSQVQAAVDDYLIAHPPAASVDPTALASTVDAYLSEHPPSPGPPPPTAEVAADVAAYLQANPPPSGPAGPAGSPGTNGSDGQQGPPGPQGEPGSPPAGWSWTDAQGDTYQCAEDDQTPAPHYTCVLASPPASASPSAPGSTAGAQDTASTSPTESATTTTATGSADTASASPTATVTTTAPTNGVAAIVADAPRRTGPTPPAKPTPGRARVPFVLVLLRREDVPL